MCLFCKIIAGEIPSRKVYEDDICLAILDISQAGKGHTLVMPKKHSDNFITTDEETLAHLIVVARQLAEKITTKMQADGCNIVINNGEKAGQAINHLHIHIIPRYDGDDYLIRGVEHEYDLDEILKTINN